MSTFSKVLKFENFIKKINIELSRILKFWLNEPWALGKFSKIRQKIYNRVKLIFCQSLKFFKD